LLGAIFIRSGLGSRQIGPGGSRIPGHVQMLRMQGQVSIGIPVGGCLMQLAAARLQQRPVNAVTHQGMNEGKAAIILRQELLIDQVRGLVTLVAQKMA
jgi:hypothetical protein